jgi:hypothetical protein
LRGSASTPTPATVWTAGPAPIELDATWPTSILRKVVTAFSTPGARVFLLCWPTPQPATGPAPSLARVGADGVIDHARATEPDSELADALAAIEDLGRTARVVRIPAGPAVTAAGSRPFWADLPGGPDHPPATAEQPPQAGIRGGLVDAAATDPADIDLLITSLRPEHSGDDAGDLVALFAARRLRTGGILTVLTHCDWTRGHLTDPTGPMVAAGQNADLLYLQHIVALHAPVTDGRFTTLPHGREAEEHARAEHRATVRGLPLPHRRIHSDVLVFAQPREHQPPDTSTADTANLAGDIR